MVASMPRSNLFFNFFMNVILIYYCSLQTLKINIFEELIK
jgi:hypothetical protein